MALACEHADDERDHQLFLFGVAHVEPGTLRFSPSIGIVGNRIEPVQSIRPAPSRNAFSISGAPLGGVSGGIGTGFIITTTGGELTVTFPTVVATEVADLLAGAPRVADAAEN